MTRIRESSGSDEIGAPPADEVKPDVRAWQEQRIAERLRAADAGRFASADAVRAVIRKYVPNG